jgi:hypothetical protein
MNARNDKLVAFSRTKRCKRTGCVIHTRVELLRGAVPVEHIEISHAKRADREPAAR